MMPHRHYTTANRKMWSAKKIINWMGKTAGQDSNLQIQVWTTPSKNMEELVLLAIAVASSDMFASFLM